MNYFDGNIFSEIFCRTDFVWARAMGYTGPQLDDSEGVDVGLDGREAEEYKYLDGRCRHYKLVGETHGSAGPSHPVVRIIINVTRKNISNC